MSRRDAILDAAEQILRSGAELTLGAVAERVGVGRTAIYRHVAGVDELITVLATRDFPLWIDSLTRAMADAQTPHDRAVAWAVESIALSRATDHAWLATLGKMDLSDKARQTIAREHRAIDELLLSELADLGISDVDTVATAVRALVRAAAGLPADQSRDAFFRASVASVLITARDS